MQKKKKGDITHAACLGTVSATIQLKCTFPKMPMGGKKKKTPKQNIFHLEEARQNNEEGLTPKDIYLFTI